MVRVQEILGSDVVPPPAVLLTESQDELGLQDVPASRYTSQEWHDLEVERLWRRVWQVACRTEELADVGDHVVYDIADDSLIVLRVSGTEIKAFHNACLHRGTQLRDVGGNVERLRCPFHGFTWNLDGTLAEIPSPWDFPQVQAERWCLPEARVAVWGGFVFVNMDADAEPLEAFLELLPDHLAPFRLDERFKAVHVSQVVPCNWKVALEAFFEGYHIAQTHPEAVASFDTDVQYDVWPGVDHTSRLITLGAVSSAAVADDTDERQILEFMQDGIPDEYLVELEDGQRARPVVAEQRRRFLSRRHRADLSGLSDSEMLDQIQYFVFPNVIPWPTVGAPLTYRFRPFGNDPNQCLMEVYFLHPRPDDDAPFKVGTEIRLEPGAPWSSVKALGGYGPIFDQDMGNLPRVQRGLRATRKPGVTLSNYQESRIRHFHRTLERWMAVDERSASAT